MTTLDVVIEIPRGSRNKYEMDHTSGRIYLDRALFTPTVYPIDYGFIDDSLGLDGDPLDAMVLLEHPAYPGVGVRVRPVGVFKMADEGGPDAKIITVPYRDPRWAHIENLEDVPEHSRQEIEHFFRHYKDLEPGKFVTVEGWGDADEAEQLVADALARYPVDATTARGN